MRPKHRNDKNHGKNGWVSGNIRYKRTAKKATVKHGNENMGKARQSKS